MRSTFTAIFLVLSLNAMANDLKECTGEQVLGYSTSSTIVEFSENERLVSMESGSSKDLYSNIKTAEVDSRTLGSVASDVKNHFTKKASNITCFKQEISEESCATYSCNLVIRD